MTGSGASKTDPAVEPEIRVDLADAVLHLLACPDPQTLVETAVQQGLRRLEASLGVFYLLGPDGFLRLRAQTGVDEQRARTFALIGLDASLPIAVVTRDHRPYYRVVDPVDSAAAELPNLVNFMVLPLLVDDRCLGGMVIELRHPRGLTDADRALLTMVVGVCAQRLDHLLRAEAAGLPVVSAPVDPADRIEASRTREVRLELAMASGNIGTFVWDIASGRLLWDERSCRLLGLEPEEFRPQITSFDDAVHPEDRGLVEEAIAESFKTGIYHATYRVIWPDGSVHWIDARGTVEWNPDGTPRTMIGVGTDCTEEQERGRRQDARTNALLKVTRALAAALSTQEVIDAMTDVLLPQLQADAVAVHIEQDGRLLLAGARGCSDTFLTGLNRVSRVAEADTPMTAALSAGRPVFFPTRADYLRRFPDPLLVPDPDHQAFSVLPLRTAEGVVGTCLFAFPRPRPLAPDDELSTMAVGGIVAQSLSRARLFDEAHRQVRALQTGMMPGRIPEIRGLEVAARYLPAARGMAVGGDWYDVVPHADGGASLVIGDVQGHSAQAAAVMGQLRTAMGAHIADGFRAEKLMVRGNETLYGMVSERFATCCVVDLSPDGGLTLVRAGHPQPLLVDAAGRARELSVTGGLPLGVEPTATYEAEQLRFGPGEILLVYTDGLVERPDRSLNTAVAELITTVERSVRRPGSLEELADAVLAAALQQPGHDDICLLLVRRLPV